MVSQFEHLKLKDEGATCGGVTKPNSWCAGKMLWRWARYDARSAGLTMVQNVNKANEALIVTKLSAGSEHGFISNPFVCSRIRSDSCLRKHVASR